MTIKKPLKLTNTCLDGITISYLLCEPSNLVIREMQRIAIALDRKYKSFEMHFDEGIKIKVTPHRSKKTSTLHKYLVIRFNPAKLLRNPESLIYLIVLINDLLKPIGKSFRDVYRDGKISRLDAAFDFELKQMMMLLFILSRVQYSGLVNELADSDIDSLGSYYKNYFPQTSYFGQKGQNRCSFYDRGLKNRKRGERMEDVAGKHYRLELRLKPRVSLQQLLKAMLIFSRYLRRFHIFTPQRPVVIGSPLHFFIRACLHDGYKPSIDALSKYSPSEAKAVKRQLRLINFNKCRLLDGLSVSMKKFKKDVCNAIMEADEYDLD